MAKTPPPASAPTSTPTPPSTSLAFPYKIDNPEEFARNMLRLVEEGTRAMTDLMERNDAKQGPFTPAKAQPVARAGII